MIELFLQQLPNYGNYGGEAAAAGGIMAMMAGLGLVILLVGIVVYIYMAIALMKIARRTDTPNGWFAFIPILNIYLMTQIGGVSGWWTAAILLGIIPILGYFAMLAFMAFLLWKVAEARNRPGWWGIIIALIPIVNLVMLGILAWGE